MTDEEKEIVESLGRVWNAFVALPVEHDMDAVEFCRIIHAAQEKVLARSGRREMNGKGRMLEFNSARST